MFRPSLFWRIFAASLFLILLTAVVAGTIAERRIVADVERETRSNLRTQVDLVDAWMRGASPTTPDVLQERVRALGARTGTRITVIRHDGLVLADSAKDPYAMEDHSGRPEILAAREAEYGSAVRYSETMGMRMMYVARMQAGAGSEGAVVRCSLPLLHLEERLDGLRGMILGGAAFAVILGLLAAALLARRIARPLRGVKEAAAAVAGGDLERRVEVRSRDEIGDLARSFNDMAERLEREVSTIRRDQREMRAILEGMVEGVIAVDAGQRLVLINDAARDILAVQEATPGGKALIQVVRLPKVAEILLRAADRGGVHSDILRLPRDGADRVVTLHASALQGDEGATRGAVLVMHDVTERDRAEAVRRDFIANASHELKTPIAAVRGLVETVLDDDAMPADTRREFLDRVMKQIQRLGDLVGEMLALSRLESEEGSIVRRRLDLRAPLREVVEDARPLAAERGVSLEPDVPGEELTVLGEVESLRRIAGNLIDNAIKYSGEGARVVVRLARRGEEILLEVTDDGPGIPPEKHARIFERFYRVDEHRSRRLGGTGLGLAIVKHLVQAHRGRIELESALGQGCTFRVCLPAAP